jgi:hypothetical protein
MEHLFSPCTRLYDLFHDIIENQPDFDEDPRSDLCFIEERNMNVSTEDFLSTERAFTYADLYAMLGSEDMVAWLTPHIQLLLVAGGD